VLVIDDDPNGLRLLVEHLKQAGYDPVAAFGAEDALRKLGRRRYQFVLIELAMKQVSGIQLIDLVKTSTASADMLVLAVTSPIRPSLMGELGCDGFIFRPVDPRRLARTLSEVQARHRHHQESRERG